MCFYGSLRDVRKECKFFKGECNSWGEICLLFPQHSSKNKTKKEWRVTLQTLNNLTIFSLARLKRRAVEIPSQSLVSISGLQWGISVRRQHYKQGCCWSCTVTSRLRGREVLHVFSGSMCMGDSVSKAFFLFLIWLQNGSNPVQTQQLITVFSTDTWTGGIVFHSFCKERVPYCR